MAWSDWGIWNDVKKVRDQLNAGADPNARLHALENTPLHNAVWHDDPDLAVVELLLQHGAAVDALNDAGETPLWFAVRYGHRAETEALLNAGADPWRPVHCGRSAGRVALDGPLADLFEDLPGAPVVSVEEQQAQAEADALIAYYGRLDRAFSDCICIGFLGGVDEDEVIRRAGADPADCHHGDVPYDDDVLWVGTAPGGVVIHDVRGIRPVRDEFCGPMSVGGVFASTFDNPAGGDQRVNLWRDGKQAGWPSPYHDPTEQDPAEAWLCRFGDHSHESFDLARNLALMSMLTGVRPELEWLATAPKRVVRVPD